MLPDMYSYMRLDLGVGLDSGNVASIGDQTGNNHGVAQAVGSKMPLFTAADSQFNNMPCATLDGVDDSLKGTNFTYGPFTIFMTARLLGTDGFLYTRNGFGDYLYINGSPELYVKRGSATLSKGSPARATATPKFYLIAYDGTEAGLRMWVNNVEVSLSAGASADPGTATTTSHWFIGSDDVSYFTNMKFSEIGIATRSLTDAERTALWMDSKNLYNLS